jgi:hypothetical protein
MPAQPDTRSRPPAHGIGKERLRSIYLALIAFLMATLDS